MSDLEFAPDTPPAFLQFIYTRSSGLAGCIPSIMARQQLTELLAEEHPEVALNNLPLPVFKANFTRMVQLATEFFTMCRVQAWFCAMHIHRYQAKDDEAADFLAKFRAEAGSSEDAARWLSMSPADFLTEVMNTLRAKALEIEQLATQIRDCAEEKDALLIPEYIRPGGKHTAGRTAQQALDGMARIKPIAEEIEERIESLRRSS